MPKLSPKAVAYLLLLLLCLPVFGLTLRAELLILCAPFAVALVAGLSSGKVLSLKVVRVVTPEHVFERDPVELTVEVSVPAVSRSRTAGFADLSVGAVEVLVPLPRDAKLLSGSNHLLMAPAGGAPRQFVCRFSMPSRRTMTIGATTVRVVDESGFQVRDVRCGGDGHLTVFPRPAQLREMVKPANTQVYTGNFASPLIGEGVEFAAVRQMQPGDRLASINWRVTARRGSYHTNRFVVDRNADIVFLLDLFADRQLAIFGTDHRSEASRTERVTDLICRCASSLAQHYISGKNRVGLVEFGYYLNYVPPGSGTRHWFRLLDRLARARVVQREITFDIGTVPPRFLPSDALVIACTALIDREFDRAVFDLKSRGFDVAVIALEIELGRMGRDPTGAADVAASLWLLESIARVRDFAAAGIPFVRWDGVEQLDAVVRRLEASRMRRR